MISPTKAFGCVSLVFLLLCCPSASFLLAKHRGGAECAVRSITSLHLCDTPFPDEGRRSALVSGVSAAATLLTSVAASTSYPSVANAVKGDASAFVGTYTDPINHPGGKRTIRLLEKQVGDYQLAEVEGGGGRGEPANYVLPAVVLGGRTIVIDFSPKGGPRDFAGVLDGGDIKFLRDGNRWPRAQ